MNDNETLEARVKATIVRLEASPKRLDPWDAMKLAALWRDLQAIYRQAASVTNTNLPSGSPSGHKASAFRVLGALFLGLGLTHATASARAPTSDAQVRQQIISQSVADYLATGHPCACPYNTARNGSSCGGRSAYSRPGGAAPLCYARDVTAGMVMDWRNAHPN